MDFGASESAREAVLTVDGKVAVAGFTNGGQNPRNFAIAKIEPHNGALDTSFSEDGKHVFDSGVDDAAFGIARAPNGALVIAGDTDAGPGTIGNFGVTVLTDSLPTASVGDATAPEGAVASFPVTLSKTSGVPLDIPFHTTNDTALAGADYDESAGVLRFEPGETQRRLAAAARTDDLVEPDESFFISIEALPMVTVADGTATGTIANQLLPAACANRITGTAAAETLTGTPAGDRVAGLGGNDTENGGNGRDCLLGGDGDDRLSGGNDADDLRGEAGRDRLDGGAANDKLAGGVGNDRLAGKAGSDSLSGSSGADYLSGGDGNDKLSGGVGNDRLSGGKGKNRYSGGAGADVISAANGRGGEKVNCGSGRDRAVVDRTDRVSGCERVMRRR